MPAVPTTFIPSGANTKGGIAGLAATAVVGYLAKAGYLIVIAGVFGLPVETVGVMLVGVVATIANMAVTHISELKSFDAVIKDIQSIKLEYAYPVDKNSPVGTPNNLENGK